MKLRLNLSLRAALMACYAMVAPVATTLFAGALIAAPQALASDSDEEEDEDSDDATAAIVAAEADATATVTTTESYDLGNVMYVGDSITHGAYELSYRWDLHKIFVDNGLTYNSIGIMQDDYYSSVQSPDSYGGVEFTNVHNAESGATAETISGASSTAKFGGSNIYNWLGLSDTMTNGNEYVVGETASATGSYGEATYEVFNDAVEGSVGSPDLFIMMIGTNDVSTDWNSWDGTSSVTTVSGVAEQVSYMDSIYAALMEASPDCTILISTIPVWPIDSTWKTNITSTGRSVVSAYNEYLYEWAESKDNENLIIVDVNEGMYDITLGDGKTYGLADMYNDGLHTSYQGNLIAAGNYAKALGYAGGTAGQYRMSETEFAVNFSSGGTVDFVSATYVESKGIVLTNTTVTSSSIQLGGNGETSSLYYAWQDGEGLDNGATLDFNLTLGNGSEDGWNTTDSLTIVFGNDSYVGMLSIDEAFISWNGSILYSVDMSTDLDNIRISWVNGEADMGLESGFYVWLDDMMIGEALQGSSGSYSEYDGITFIYSGDGEVYLNDLSIEGSQSYAPTTEGLTNEESAYYATADNPDGPSSSDLVWNADGSVVWTSVETTASLTASGGDYGASAQISGASGDLNIVVNAGSATANRIYGSYGSYTGDIWVEINSGAIANSSAAWYAAHGCGGSATGASWVVNGSVMLKFTDDATGSQVNADGSLSGSGATVLGAINGGTINGSVYLEFSAANLHLGNGYSGFGASVAGTYNSEVNGDMHMVFNMGTFESAIYGGTIGTTASTITGATYIDINGGTFNGNVYGGGAVGSIGSGVLSYLAASTNVTVAAGTINASVYGGGSGGTITGNTSVELTGGTITGDVYGGGTGGTITGSTTVSIDGSDVILHDGTNWGTVTAGSTAGSIAGNSTLSIKNVSSSDNAYGFDKFAGTLSGGTVTAGTRELILDDVVVDNFAAKIENFDTISLYSGTKITLTNTAGVTVSTLNLDVDLELTIAEGVSFTTDKLSTVYVNYDDCDIINHGTFSFTDATVFKMSDLDDVFSGDGVVNLAGVWDIGNATTDGTTLATFGDNTVNLADGLVLDLLTGLDEGTYALFSADSVTGLDTGLDTVTIDGLSAGQTYSLSFDDGILSLIISQMAVMTWDDSTDSFGDGDTATSYLELNSNAASLTVALSEDITGATVGLTGSNAIAISGHELSSTGGISVDVSNLSFGEGGALSGEMSFTGATAIDAGNLDIAATAATTIDGTLGFNSLSGDISNASMTITGAVSMKDVTADSSTSLALSGTLTLAGETSLSNVSLSSGASFITEAGASVSVNGEAQSYSSAKSYTTLRHDLSITLGADSTLSQDMQYWLASTSSSIDIEVNINGSGTYEVTSFLMRYTDTGDVTLNINDDATMYITNTKTTTSDAYAGFVTSGAKGVNGESIVNISGTLELDSGIVAFGEGNGTINVLEGGDLVLNRGTLSYSAGGDITIDVEGGTVQLGNTVDDTYVAASASDDLSVLSMNLYDGASIYGTGVTFSSAGFTATTTTNIYQSLTIAESGTLNIGTASGSTVNLYSDLSDGDYSTNLNVTGGTLNVASTVSVSSLSSTGSSAATTVTGTLNVGDASGYTGTLTVSTGDMTIASATAANPSTIQLADLVLATATGGGSLTIGDNVTITDGSGATTAATGTANNSQTGDFTLTIGENSSVNSQDRLLLYAGGDFTLSGSGSYTITALQMCSGANTSTSLTVEAGATMNIIGANNGEASGAAFNVGYFAASNTIDVSGTLNVNASMYAGNGYAAITVYDGGTLQLNSGLDYTVTGSNTTHSSITVQGNGRLILGNGTQGADSTLLDVTLQDGATLAAATVEGGVVSVYENISYAGTTNFVGSDAKLIMASAVSNASGTANITGSVEFAGGASLQAVELDDDASLALGGEVSISDSITLGSGASIDLSDVTSLSLGENLSLVLEYELEFGTDYTIFTGASSDVSADLASITSEGFNSDLYEYSWNFDDKGNIILSLSSIESDQLVIDPTEPDISTDADETVNYESVIVAGEDNTTISGEGAIISETLDKSGEGTLEISASVDSNSITVSGGSIEIAEGGTLSSGAITVTALDAENSASLAQLAADTNATLVDDTLSEAALKTAAVSVDGDAELKNSTIASDSSLQLHSGQLTIDSDSSVAASTSVAEDASMVAGLITVEGTDATEGTSMIGSELKENSLSGGTVSNALIKIDALVVESRSFAAVQTFDLTPSQTSVVTEPYLSDTTYINTTFELAADSTLTMTNVTLSGDCIFTVGDGASLTANNLTLNLDSTSTQFSTSLVDASSGDLVLTVDTFSGFSAGDVTIDGTLMVNLELTGSDYAIFEQWVTGESDNKLVFTMTGLTDVDFDLLVLTFSNNGADVYYYVWGDFINSENSIVDGNLVVSLSQFNVIPEPSTATLSLLALAGLLARRRRRAVRSESGVRS